MRLLASSLALSLCLCHAALASDSDIRTLIDGGHWKQARALLEPRVKANPSDAEAAALLSRVRLAFADFEGAVRLAETAVKLDARVAEYHWQLARACGEQARRANMFRQISLGRRFRDEAQATIALDPNHIQARFGLISFHVHAPGIIGGDRKKADQLAEEVARIDAAHGYLARARVLEESGAAGDREALYKQAAEAAKTPAVRFEARVALLNTYLSGAAPKLDLAEQQARELLKIDPRRAAGHTGLALAYASNGRWTELEAALADAEKAVPDNLMPYYQAGRAIVAQGSDLPRAERYLRKYLTQDPEAGAAAHAHAHWRLGQLFEKQGRRADAVAELETALKLKPDLEDAKKDLKRIRST